MAEQPLSIMGFSGVDRTTDELLLPVKDPKKSNLVYNYRAKNSVKRGRFAYRPVIDYAGGQSFKYPGVYFPPDSFAHIPLTTLNLDQTFYVASTDETDQEEFTIEFWYKCKFLNKNRVISNIPVSYNDTNYQHMNVYFWPYAGDIGNYYLYLQFVTYNSGAGTFSQRGYYSNAVAFSGDLPADDEWHHIAISRGTDTTTEYPALYIDATFDAYLSSAAHSTDPLPTIEQFLSEQTEPQKWNWLRLGDDEMHLAEFRIWNTERSATEISTYMDVPLDGDEEGLVCYVPFNEGNGKTFEEKVTGATGFFCPQEPYVNDDNELVFTGRDCFAFPSLRSNWRWDPDWADASPWLSGLEKIDEHKSQNEDGCYDGGILWDTMLQRDWAGTDVSFDEGILRGVAQLRIRLRQLKESTICGRLGMAYDPTSMLYRLFFYDDTNETIYESEPIIGEEWIGVEHTITVCYNGIAESEIPTVLFFVDTTDVSDYVSGGITWGNGDELNDSANDKKPFRDSPGDESSLSGALGGSTEIDDMCLAFDLIFFRQWWDLPPGYNDNILYNTFVSETYDQDILPSKYRNFFSGFDGYFYDNDDQIYLESRDYIDVATDHHVFVRIPIHLGSDGYTMDGEESFIWIDKGTTTGIDDCGIFKQDVYVKRCNNWAEVTTPLNSVAGIALLTIDTDYTYKISPRFGTCPGYVAARHFNNASISNLVNDFNWQTFKKNRFGRPVYIHTIKGFGAEVMNLKIFEAIDDDCPLQGIERIGGYNYKSRYLYLTALGDRESSIYNMKSFKPRWCTGPLELITNDVDFYPIRGIFRYKSENEKVNKLLFVAGCSIYSIDSDTGALTEEERGWIDRNGDSLVKSLIVNNRAVFMDNGNQALKLNYKGNFTRLGVERPVDVYYNLSWGACDILFNEDDQYAWSARFIDEENNAKSGIIPIFADMGQSVVLRETGVNNLQVCLRGSKDENITQFEVFRTLNLAPSGAGTEDAVFLVKRSENNRFDAVNKFRDIWSNTQIASDTDVENPSNLVKDTLYREDLVPVPGYGMGVGYKRFWIFGNDENRSSLYFSTLDGVGFGLPDEIPETTNRIIVDEGGTSSGTALLEFNGQLFAFKSDAIFRVYPVAADTFGVELIYKGVGAISQHVVAVAGNMMVFLDKSGLYGYKGGEPFLLDPGLVDFFKNDVNVDELGKSFLLFNKEEEEILLFVPSEGSSFCDLCVVYNIRQEEMATIDMVPDMTCGYVDDGTIYLGTPYGQIYVYTKDEFVDSVVEAFSGTGSVT